MIGLWYIRTLQRHHRTLRSFPTLSPLSLSSFFLLCVVVTNRIFSMTSLLNIRNYLRPSTLSRVFLPSVHTNFASSTLLSPNIPYISSILSSSSSSSTSTTPSSLSSSSSFSSFLFNGNYRSIRTFATITKRRRKVLRKRAALHQRHLLKFASLFDPLRVSKLQIEQTLKLMGWLYTKNEKVQGTTTSTNTEGITLDYSLLQYYCAFEIVDGKHYVLPTDSNASNDYGYGPDISPPLLGTKLLDKSTVFPSSSPFPLVPPSWKSPTRGLVLDKETAARHAIIREKGWKLIVLPQPLIEYCASLKYNRLVRRDLIMSLTTTLLPFEARPLELQQAVKTAEIAMKKARRTNRSLESSGSNVSNGPVEELSVEKKARNAAKAAAELDSARDASSTGRSRAIRMAARRKVSAATDVQPE